MKKKQVSIANKIKRKGKKNKKKITTKQNKIKMNPISEQMGTADTEINKPFHTS